MLITLRSQNTVSIKQHYGIVIPTRLLSICHSLFIVINMSRDVYSYAAQTWIRTTGETETTNKKTFLDYSHSRRGGAIESIKIGWQRYKTENIYTFHSAHIKWYKTKCAGVVTDELCPTCGHKTLSMKGNLIKPLLIKKSDQEVKITKNLSTVLCTGHLYSITSVIVHSTRIKTCY